MSWSAAERELFASLVRERTWLCLERRWDAAEPGIRRAMARAHVDGLGAYLALLAVEPRALDVLVEEVTVGETYFFREPGQFEWIRAHFLPAWQARAAPRQILRAWSAGCATGEEAYSLAIVFEEAGLGARATVLATDISRAALARARHGVFRRWSLRGPAAGQAAAYLQGEGDKLRLADSLRHRVVFAPLNLARDDYAEAGAWGMDLILCRNVMIYFDAATVARVAAALYAALAEGGWLLTAASDPPLTELAPFEMLVTEAGVFYQRPCTEPEEAAPEIQEASADMLVPATAPADEASEDAAAAVQRLRVLANAPGGAAERACAEALEQYPLSVELHFLHVACLLEQGEETAALEALRRVLYLDRGAAVAHFCLGSVLARRGDRAGARRAFRNVADLCAARPTEEPVPLGEGETWGQLASAAAAQLARLEQASE